MIMKLRSGIVSAVVVTLGALAGVATVIVVSLVLYREIGSGEPHPPQNEQQPGVDAAEQAPEYDELAVAVEELGFQAVRNSVTAEEFELTALSGEELTLSSFEGALVLLNFWATWCPPCVEEMPSLQNLHDRLDRHELSVLGVNVQEDPETVAEFVERLELAFPIVLDRSGAVSRRYAVRGMPMSYLIAPDGRVLGAKVGFHIWDAEGFPERFRAVLELSS